jgi:hypothetical protein
LKPLTYLLVDFENLQPAADDVAQVRGEECRLWVFHGPHQNKFAAEMVVAWQPLGDRVRFIQSSRSGKNALDFHIAFYLGQVHREDTGSGRAARYVVVSKDGGFDALFDHMRSLGCAVGKATTILEALDVAEALLQPGQARLQERIENSATPSKTQPRSSTRVGEKATAANAKAAETPHACPPPKPAAKRPVTALRNSVVAEDLEKVITVLRGGPNNRPAGRTALEHHIMCILGSKVTMEVIKDVIKQLQERQIIAFNGNEIEYRIPKKKKAKTQD